MLAVLLFSGDLDPSEVAGLAPRLCDFQTKITENVLPLFERLLQLLLILLSDLEHHFDVSESVFELRFLLHFLAFLPLFCNLAASSFQESSVEIIERLRGVLQLFIVLAL